VQTHTVLQNPSFGLDKWIQLEFHCNQDPSSPLILSNFNSWWSGRISTGWGAPTNYIDGRKLAVGGQQSSAMQTDITTYDGATYVDQYFDLEAQLVGGASAKLISFITPVASTASGTMNIEYAVAEDGVSSQSKTWDGTVRYWERGSVTLNPSVTVLVKKTLTLQSSWVASPDKFRVAVYTQSATTSGQQTGGSYTHKMYTIYNGNQKKLADMTVVN